MGILIVIIVVIVVISIMSSDGKNPETQGPSRKSDDIEKIRGSSEAYVTVNVAELENDYDANYLAAQKKYNRRKLSLTGRLTEIRKNSSVFPEFRCLSEGYFLRLGNQGGCYFARYPYSYKLTGEQLDEEMLKLRTGQMMSIEGVWIDEPVRNHGRIKGLYGCSNASWSVIS